MKNSKFKNIVILLLVIVAIVEIVEIHTLKDRCDSFDEELSNVSGELEAYKSEIDSKTEKTVINTYSYVKNIDTKNMTYNVEYSVEYDEADAKTKVVVKDEYDNEIVLKSSTSEPNTFSGVLNYSLKNSNFNAYATVYRGSKEIAYEEIYDCGFLYSEYVKCSLVDTEDEEIITELSNDKVVIIAGLESYYEGVDAVRTEFYACGKKVFETESDGSNLTAPLDVVIDLNDREIKDGVIEGKDIYSRIETEDGTVYEVYPDIAVSDDAGNVYVQNEAIIIKGKEEIKITE